MKPKHLMVGLLGLGCACFGVTRVLDFVERRKDPERHRFYNLADEIQQAFKNHDFDNTEALAWEYLRLADQFSQDWNYGNAIHTSHQSLGLIQFHRGNVEQAKEHLIAAGRTPGSPQLNSYGPQMTLARKLLEIGEKESVICYLNLVAKFWVKDNTPIFQHVIDEHKTLIEQWKSDVEIGRVPNHKQWN